MNYYQKNIQYHKLFVIDILFLSPSMSFFRSEYLIWLLNYSNALRTDLFEELDTYFDILDLSSSTLFLISLMMNCYRSKELSTALDSGFLYSCSDLGCFYLFEDFWEFLEFYGNEYYCTILCSTLGSKLFSSDIFEAKGIYILCIVYLGFSYFLAKLMTLDWASDS